MFSGSIVAIVTPMKRSGEIDYNALIELVEWHIEQGSDGLVVMGTTGESALVTEQEFFDAVSTVVKQANKRIKVIAGTGTMSTAKTVSITQQVQSLGVDGALVVTPYYCKPTQEGLYLHFSQIAHNTTLPIILYNVPGRTGCDLLPATVARLAKIDNIVAIKEATGNVSRVKELKELCDAPMTLLSGDDATALEFMRLGGSGVISVTANIAPRLMSNLCQLAMQENWQQASLIDQKLSALHNNLFLEANPIPVKWALAKMGLIEESIRMPMTWLSEEYHPVILEALEQANVEIQ